MQNVPPALLVRFLREHRQEWNDNGVDVYSAASNKPSPYAIPCPKLSGLPSGHVPLPLVQTVENEEVNFFTLSCSLFSPFMVT